MITDPRDPAYDDRCYCPDCLALIDEDEIEAMGDDPIEAPCPHCGNLIASTLTTEQMRDRHAEARADEWRSGMDDGLIR